MSGQRSPRKIFIIASIVIVAMFAFSFALVPLYNAICKATGINNTVLAADLAKPPGNETYNQAIDNEREITVQFVAVNHNGLPWTFRPNEKVVRIHPGESKKITYFARNETEKTMTIQAIPSMTPPEAISHFHKIECFCFNQQTLKGREGKDMALIFKIDKDLPKNIHTVTLAYTLFDVTKTARKDK